CVWFSVVYLGEHYVVDALDGVVYVAVAVLLVELAGRRLGADRARGGGPADWRFRRPAGPRPRGHTGAPEGADGGGDQERVAQGQGDKRREGELGRWP